MEIKTIYKIISDELVEIEPVLNLLSEDGWRPVTMSCHGRPAIFTVILENKIMEEEKLNLSSAIGETDTEISLEDIQ